MILRQRWKNRIINTTIKNIFKSFQHMSDKESIVLHGKSSPKFLMKYMSILREWGGHQPTSHSENVRGCHRVMLQWTADIWKVSHEKRGERSQGDILFLPIWQKLTCTSVTVEGKASGQNVQRFCCFEKPAHLLADWDMYILYDHMCIRIYCLDSNDVGDFSERGGNWGGDKGNPTAYESVS